MAKFYLLEKEKGHYVFDCPGCGYSHSITTLAPNESGNIWHFNGNLEKPSVCPSLLVNKHHPESRCHSIITNGKIQFLPDCYHHLKGKTVDLPECGWGQQTEN